MTLKYCDGNVCRAEAVFGWDRQNVEVGLAEKRTGIECVSLHAAFSGRPRWENQYPEAAQVLSDLAHEDNAGELLNLDPAYRHAQ